MPARVTGDKRILNDTPGALASDALDRARREIEERRIAKDKKKNPTTPRPSGDVPEGYEDLDWSESEGYWVCFSKTEDEKGMIWENDKWCTWDDWEKGMRHN